MAAAAPLPPAARAPPGGAVGQAEAAAAPTPGGPRAEGAEGLFVVLGAGLAAASHPLLYVKLLVQVRGRREGGGGGAERGDGEPVFNGGSGPQCNGGRGAPVETSVCWGPLYIQPPPLNNGTRWGHLYNGGGTPIGGSNGVPHATGTPHIRGDEVTPCNGGPCVTGRMRAALKWGGLYDAIG